MRSRTALMAVTGQSPELDFEYVLSEPSQCLILEKEDWHRMQFGAGAVLLVLASEEYSPDDYFYEKYRP